MITDTFGRWQRSAYFSVQQERLSDACHQERGGKHVDLRFTAIFSTFECVSDAAFVFPGLTIRKREIASNLGIHGSESEIQTCYG